MPRFGGGVVLQARANSHALMRRVRSRKASERRGNTASRRPRILIADDNVDGAMTLGMLLNLSGYEVHLAHTGSQALESILRIRPDIVVCDIGMPELNGYEVARCVRREPWGASITLIAMTGWGDESDQHRAVAAGFNHHLMKPVDPDVLEELLGK